MQLTAKFHRGKLEQVREELEHNKLDGLLVMNPVNIYYLTGFWYKSSGVMERPVLALISLNQDPILMVSLDVFGHKAGGNQPSAISARETDALGDLSPVVSDIQVYTEYPYTNGIPTLTWACRQIEEAGLRDKVLGVEDNFTPINDGVCEPWYNQVAATFKGKVVPAGSLVNRMRMVHDPEEVNLVRQASYYADELVRAISEELRVGRTEEEVSTISRARVEAAMREELKAIIPSLATGRITAGTPRAFHDTLTSDPGHTLQSGVPIIINCFATVGGYHGESERCGLLGTPTDRQKTLFDIAMESEIRAKEAVRPGVQCGEVDLVAKKFIEQAGFDYLYGVGHGIGLLGHEPPWVREGSETVLEAGMCITVEPGLAVPGEGSFHCSETVLVTDDGCEPLTVHDGIHRFDLP